MTCSMGGISRHLDDGTNLNVARNCFFSNTVDFSNYPPAYGDCSFQNENGTPADFLNNICADPKFAETEHFTLMPDSPCIDAGKPDAEFNDKIFPPSQGTVRNDIGATGGPLVGHTDVDDDGLWDDWEIEWFGDLATSDGSGDADSDGLTDLEEFLCQTDPTGNDSDGDGFDDGAEKYAGTDPNDSLETPDVHMAFHKAVEIVFLGEAGKTYQVEELIVGKNSAEWQPFGSEFSGSPGPNSRFVSTRNQKTGIFRVVELQSP